MEQDLLQIREARKGNASAFATLYESIYPDLYRFALYTLKNPEDAEDVVSDTVIDAFASISKLRSEEAFNAWIFKILSNKCKKRLGEYYSDCMELKENFPDPSSDQDMEENLWIRNQFFQLDGEARLIISMHLFAGYSSKEIGRILHMNDNTVRSKERRALKKIAAQIEKER